MKSIPVYVCGSTVLIRAEHISGRASYTERMNRDEKGIARKIKNLQKKGYNQITIIEA